MSSMPDGMRWFGRDGKLTTAYAHQDNRRVAPRSVLVVEDDPDILAMLALAFEIEGYVVIPCTDGRAALSYLDTGATPACIVLDLRLPTLDGATLRHLLRRDPRWANIPVVLMSAYPHGAMMANTLGVTYFPKPFEVDDLLVEVGRLCGR